jgi:zinc protease
MKAIDKALFSNPADFVFTFVGNIDMDEFKPLVEKYLGSLPKSKKSLTWLDDEVRIPHGIVENRFTSAMQVPKTTVMYVYNGQIPYTLKHSLLFQTMSQILDIRYTKSIREEKGGTYGVGTMGQTNFTPVEQYILLVNFDTDPALADELMGIVELEIKEIAENGVKAEDLAKAKEYLIKKHPDDIKQNSYWSGAIGTFHTSGYDFTTGYLDVVNSITSDDLRLIAKQMLEENNIVKVIMDPAAAE